MVQIKPDGVSRQLVGKVSLLLSLGIDTDYADRFSIRGYVSIEAIQ